MSLKVKSNWRTAANAFGLAASLWLVGLYLWAGLARNRWHWASSCSGRSGASSCFPSTFSRELKKPKELVPVDRGREFTGPFCV